MKKKSKKKLSQAKLLKKYEKIMKPIILARDGNRCQLKNYRVSCGPYLCMDHRPAKRGKHATFFDPRNLTTVCTIHNQQAEYDPFVNDAILAVVRKREGSEIIKILEEESRAIKKWVSDEIEKWIEDCRVYFAVAKNGRPEYARPYLKG